MTVEEIFKTLADHMLKGIMTHEQLANYYDFLGLGGYKRCHEYHFYDETCGYRKLQRYFINHYGRLIEQNNFEQVDMIPASWYTVSREDVDNSTRQSAVKAGIQAWVSWERETKKLYERMYQELMGIDEVAAALFIKRYICDVDCELKKAQRYWLNKKAISYDMDVIVAEQKEMHDKYKKKMCQLFEYKKVKG